MILTDRDPFAGRLTPTVPWIKLPLWAVAWRLQRGVVFEANVSYHDELVDEYELGRTGPHYAAILTTLFQVPIDPTTGRTQ